MGYTIVGMLDSFSIFSQDKTTFLPARKFRRMLIAMAIFQMIVDVAIFPTLNLRYTLVD